MDMDTAVPAKEVKSMSDLIEELHRVFAEDAADIDYVKSLLESYKSNPSDWKKYVNFDAYRYTRNLVDEGNGKFNLMILCWGEGHSSSIHDHSDAHCFVKILAGHLKETIYEWPNHSDAAVDKKTDLPGSSTTEEKKEKHHNVDTEPLKQKEIQWYSREQVTYINDSIGLHRVENPSHSDRAVSLHLYSPPFGSCNMFDERTGLKRTARMTFWSRKGQLDMNGVDCQENSMQPRPLNGLLSKIGC